MKYFGREDRTEGGMYSVGFHWGYIRDWSPQKAIVERYIGLLVPTPFHMVKSDLASDLRRMHEWRLVAFAAWPYKDFESRFRYTLMHFWSPLYGR